MMVIFRLVLAAPFFAVTFVIMIVAIILETIGRVIAGLEVGE